MHDLAAVGGGQVSHPNDPRGVLQTALKGVERLDECGPQRHGLLEAVRKASHGRYDLRVRMRLCGQVIY